MDELPTAATLAGRIDAAGASSLERLEHAVRIAGELDRLGEQVVERYVESARADGRTWSQIGGVLGVTKQAAQQRFVAPAPSAWPGMSEGGAEVMRRAAQEARALRHRYLGTEHLLLALASDDGLAGSALRRLGVSPAEVAERIGSGHSSETATLGVTALTKRVLEAAVKEARRLGHRCADPEHLLLAVSEHAAARRRSCGRSGANRATSARSSPSCSRARRPSSPPGCGRRRAGACAAPDALGRPRTKLGPGPLARLRAAG